MKRIFSLLLIISPLVCMAQKKCDTGHSWMPSIGTSSLRIVANKCLPDSVCKKLWLTYHKNSCEESGIIEGGGDFYHTSVPRWVNDSVGCMITETYKKRVDKNWVEITKCEYYMNVNSICLIHTLNKETVEVPCCGHLHPPGDWKTIIKSIVDK